MLGNWPRRTEGACVCVCGAGGGGGGGGGNISHGGMVSLMLP